MKSCESCRNYINNKYCGYEVDFCCNFDEWEEKPKKILCSSCKYQKAKIIEGYACYYCNVIFSKNPISYYEKREEEKKMNCYICGKVIDTGTSAETTSVCKMCTNKIMNEYIKRNSKPVMLSDLFKKEQEACVANELLKPTFCVDEIIEKLIENELIEANKKFKPFSSTHEGYAVLLEEVEETKEDIKSIEEIVSYIWVNIKYNDLTNVEKFIKDTKTMTVRAIKELIQVAAMCDKFEKLLEGEK